jgi:hypothetical protein
MRPIFHPNAMIASLATLALVALTRARGRLEELLDGVYLRDEASAIMSRLWRSASCSRWVMVLNECASARMGGGPYSSRRTL